MSDLLTRLRALDKPIGIGLIGIGNIGKGMLFQTTITPGMTCVAVADNQINHAIDWIKSFQIPYRIVENVTQMHEAIKHGFLAVCEDGKLIGQCEFVDVQVDATSSIFGGLEFCQNAIDHHKHVIMMNSEADLMFGSYLLDKAQKEGVVYTSADGDQHTVIKRLINEVEFMGFRIVMAGNSKGYLDPYSNPTTIIPEAEKRSLDNIMCTSYTDGTKLNIEMALIANGIGGRTDVPGMHGPFIKDITNVSSYFDFETLWDGKTAIVDYTIGTYPPGGIFVVGFTDHPHQQATIEWYPSILGDGPFYVFHRPYHLGHFEYLACVAEAYLDNWAVLQPTFGMKTNVYTYTKEDLKIGETLDGIGGYKAYGKIENTSENQTFPGLPICLAKDVKINRQIPRDEKIYLKDIDSSPLKEKLSVYNMNLQDLL